MKQYLIATRFLPGVDVRTLPERSQRVHDALAAIDPDFLDRWSCEYMIAGGSIDAIDVVRSDDEAEVRRMAAVIAQLGECTTEVAEAVPWRKFIDSISEPAAPVSANERRNA
jgi:uncharacterized protein with GYD domain